MLVNFLGFSMAYHFCFSIEWSKSVFRSCHCLLNPNWGYDEFLGVLVAIECKIKNKNNSYC